MAHVHVRFLRHSAFYTPLLLALEPDGLRTEGLTASSDVASPASTIEQGLLEGSVQLAQSAPAVSFAPSLAGRPLPYRHFALLNSRDGFFLAARDRSAPFTWGALEGRTVLVDHFFQPLAFFRAALRRNGVDETRVRFVDAGDVAGIEAAFRVGLGDFVHMQGPTPQVLELEGLARVVASIGEATGAAAFSSLVALPGWAGTDAARAFHRCYRRARRDAAVTPAAELARRIAPALPGASSAALEATIAAYQRMGTWAGEDVIDEGLLARTAQLFAEVGALDGRPRAEDVLMAPPGD